MTVKELFGACQRQIARGNGNKEIYVAKDEEGNEFVPITYEFTDEVEEISGRVEIGIVRTDKLPEEIVLLG